MVLKRNIDLLKLYFVHSLKRERPFRYASYLLPLK